mgnify:CR=1 FL=1
MSSAEMLVLRPASLPPLSRLVLRAAVLVMIWETRHRTRAHLAQLDQHMLKDIGLDPLTARAETDQPFWRG